MCSQVSMQTGVLGILCASAVGAGNPKLAGVYLQVSLAVLTPVMLAIAVCWWYTEAFWLNPALSTTAPMLAHMAGYYARVLSLSLPIEMVTGQIRQFFASQMILHPEANAAIVALVGNLVLGFILVLGIPGSSFDGFGFTACPWVTAGVDYIQGAALIGIYWCGQQLHRPAWDGWAWTTAVTGERVLRFLELYVPAALATASDFWRVAVIGLVAARLGPSHVAVFHTSYRIIWIVLIIVSALASAAGIQATTRLGQMNAKGAKQAAWVGIEMGGAVVAVAGLLVYIKIEWFARIFTSDPALLALFVEARLPLVITLVTMNMSVALEKVPYSMGRTREVFWYGFIASWLFQVPGVYFCTLHWRADIVGVFSGMAIGYTALMFIYGTLVINCEWEKHAKEARERSEMPVEAK